MLARANRLHLSADLRRVLRQGRRFALPAGTIHVLITTDPAPSRFAVITPKSVGNAVSRHAVARAVRHSWLPLLTQRPTGLELVVRAQTGAASLSVADWTAACQQAIESAVRRG